MIKSKFVMFKVVAISGPMCKITQKEKVQDLAADQFSWIEEKLLQRNFEDSASCIQYIMAKFIELTFLMKDCRELLFEDRNSTKVNLKALNEKIILLRYNEYSGYNAVKS